MRFSLAFASGLALLALSGMTACKQPMVAPPTQEPTAQGTTKLSPTSPQFGSYNIHKRHGLGGWDRSAGPSQKTLLQDLEASTQPHTNPFAPERKN